MIAYHAQYPYAGDDPAGVESAMTDLRGVGVVLGALAAEVEHDTQAVRERWPKGHTGQVAAADAARIGGALDECHRVFNSAERGLSELHPVLVMGRRKVDELNRAYRVLAGQVDGSDGVVADADFLGAAFLGLWTVETFKAAQARAGFDSLADIDRAYARVHLQVMEESTICEGLLNRLATQASGMPAYTARKSKYDVSFGLLAEANEVAGILDGSVRLPSDPKGVHDAWLLLSEDQQTELLRGDPGRFGNLSGIPAVDRNTANRATLAAQMLLIEKACAEVGIAPPRLAEDFDRIPPDMLSILEFLGLSVQGARQTLLLKAQLERDGVPTQLWAYEPGAYGGKGRAAIAYGDLDTADNVAFCVPGLNSGLHNVNQVAGDALHLFEQARLADGGRQTAVIAWQGYDAPDLAHVVSQDSAERGAKLLAADVMAIRTTHAGPIGTLTVVGHSYGSTTTGLALQREHLQVDQVALIGSPGVGGDAKTVADLGMDSAHLFVGSASRDAVSMAHSLSANILGADTLGTDPSLDTFGGTRFKAESVDRGFDYKVSDHSRYYGAINRSDSLFSLAEIASGHGDRLAADGMVAEPRQQVGIDITDLPPALRRVLNLIPLPRIPLGLETDPEFGRTPTAGDHTNDVMRPSL